VQNPDQAQMHRAQMHGAQMHRVPAMAQEKQRRGWGQMLLRANAVTLVAAVPPVVGVCAA
jgi:hypothetical protein